MGMSLHCLSPKSNTDSRGVTVHRGSSQFLEAVPTAVHYSRIRFSFRIIKRIPLHTGKVAIATGGAKGIGFYVSKGLVAKNVHVIIAGKSSEDGVNAISAIRKDFPNAKVDFMQLDLASLKSVKEFAEQFISRDLELHILVNNGGVMFPPYQITEDGFESQLQINFLSHLFLTQLLKDKITRSGADNCWARIVNVASSVQLLGSPDLEKLDQRHHLWYQYSSHKAYADSKLLVVAGSYKLDSLFRNDGEPVSVCAVHPGVVKTGLWRHLHTIHRILMQLIQPWSFLTPEQGADTILYAAMSPEVEGQSGCYYDNSKPCTSKNLTYDKEFQELLWTKCNMMIEEALLYQEDL